MHRIHEEYAFGSACLLCGDNRSICHCPALLPKKNSTKPAWLDLRIRAFSTCQQRVAVQKGRALVYRGPSASARLAH